MTVDRIGYANVNGDGTAKVIVSADASCLDGDWLLAVIGMTSSGFANDIVTPPAGWTIVVDRAVAGTLGVSIFKKKRVGTDGAYTFSVSTNRIVDASLMWFRGATDTGWITGTGRNRSGSSFDSVALPITATADNTLALAVALERTTATSDTVSWTGATPWHYKADSVSGGHPTIAVAYNTISSGSASPTATATFNNTQASNGWAIQLGIPAAVVTPPPVSTPFSRWTGAAEVPVTVKAWNGVAEVPIGTVTPYYGNWTVTDLLSTPTFYIAHRGGGMNWPEHTMRSYTGAAQWGMKAMEISTHITSDGSIVCHHDTSTLRMTGTDYTIATTPLATLQTLTNTAVSTDNPGQNRQPIPLLSDVLDKFGRSHVLFIEPKVGGSWNLNTLFPMIASKCDPQRVVYKSVIDSTLFPNAKAQGWMTWGYITVGSVTLNNLDLYISKTSVDLIGIDRNLPDATVQNIVAIANGYGKRCIMWEIRSIVDRDRALALGCVGLMTANLHTVLPKFP